jgi:hypothetical protein
VLSYAALYWLCLHAADAADAGRRS